MFDRRQIARTTARFDASPDAARQEMLAVLIPKARAAARDLLVDAAALADFAAVRDHYAASSLQEAVERHGKRLDAFAQACDTIRNRIHQLCGFVADDDRWQAEAKEARDLALAAISTVRALRDAWAGEGARLLRQEEIGKLRFSTAMEALEPMLEPVADADADAIAA